MVYPKSNTPKESVEGAKFYLDEVIKIIGFNGSAVLLREGELSAINEKIERAKQDLNAVLEQINQAKTYLAVQLEKNRVEFNKVYQTISKRNAESLELLESVKKFVGRVEREEWNRLQNQAKKEVVAA